jgi:Putative auto-transporter adhesin, head GIN domain
MVHRLVTIAVMGLGASAALMGAAAAIGGRDFSDGFGGLFDGRPRCEAVPGATATTRDLDWDGSDHAALNLLGKASYTPGAGNKLHASGDPQVLAHLRVRNGTVELNCRGWRDRTADLAITLPGRTFDKFEVIGGRLVLNNLSQTNVEVDIAGSGKVQASGKLEEVKLAVAGSGEMNLDQFTAKQGEVEIAGSGTVRARGAIDDLKIEIGGSGRADFGQVASRIAKVEIGGHGNVDIAPTDEANIEIGGSGDVNLHSNPKRLDTEIGGSGNIHHLAGG